MKRWPKKAPRRAAASPWSICPAASFATTSGFSGVVEELYDVAVIPGAVRPMLLGFKTDEIKHMIRPAG